MRSRPLSVLAGTTLVVVALLAALSSPAGADPETQAGISWLLDQQEADGGFELGDFPPFETPDAIVAIAADAQTTATWSTSEALAAVEAADDGTAGATPLDWADDFAENDLDDDSGTPGLDGGQAAKLIVYIAAPLGLSTTAFDPSEDGDPQDLEAILAADPPPNGLFNSALYAAVADDLTDSNNLDERFEQIRDAQQANGGWGFAGDPDGTDVDVDTTGYAVMALMAGGTPAGDANVEAGLRFLAANHEASGSWAAFGSGNVNSTATGLFALEGAGWSSADDCWRSVNAPSRAGQPYVDPDAYIRTQQLSSPPADAGRFQSPNDGFGVNSYATSQAVQGLLGSWFPTATGSASLQPAETFTDVGPCQAFTQGVAWMQDNGLTTGFGDGTFRPNQGMARQAMAAQLFRFVDPDGFEAPETPTFTDVPTTHLFYEEIEWMVSEGITTGFGDGTFRPAGTVNRGQAATFLYRVAGEPVLEDDAPTFPDVADGSVFADGVSWMADFRLTAGFPGGTFKPANTLNRAQLAQFLYRLASTEPAWDDISLPPSVQF
jgi:hypothetical protein